MSSVHNNSSVETSFIKEQDLLKEVRNFVKGSARDGKVSRTDVVKSAVVLLKHLPSTRTAVLEFFSNVYDEFISNLLRGDDTDPTGLIIDDIQCNLLELLNAISSGWAPVLSAWSVELLGKLSSTYSDKYGHLRHLSLPASLSDTLQMWMSCKATKSLIEITSQCFAAMVGATPDSCVDVLLETSVQHSPNFDWVVAYIGSCFPHTIVGRVLMCGLRDYSQSSHMMDQSSQATFEQRLPKFASAVSILSHLATTFSRELRASVMALFHDCLTSEDRDVYDQTVPYLLHLISRSSELRKVITEDFVHALTLEVIEKLYKQSSSWFQRGLEDRESLINMAVHIVNSCENGNLQVLELLIQLAYPQTPLTGTTLEADGADHHIKKTCRIILERIFTDMSKVLQKKTQYDPIDDLPFLKGLEVHTSAICDLLVTANRQDGDRFRCLAQLVRCLALLDGITTATRVMSQLITTIKDRRKLGFFVQLLVELKLRYADLLSHILQSKFTTLHRTEELITTLQNVQDVVRWSSPIVSSQNMFHHCIQPDLLYRHIPMLFLYCTHTDPHVVTLSMELIVLTALPDYCDVHLICQLCHIVYFAFFVCLQVKGEKMRLFNLCRSLTAKLTPLRTGQKTLLWLLLQGALDSEKCMCFGGKPCTMSAPVQEPVSTQRSLLQNNLKNSSFHLDSMHNGMIGHGLRPHDTEHIYSKEEIQENKQLFMSILHDVCCRSGASILTDNNGEQNVSIVTGKNIPVTVGKTAALILIDIVAPDAMYNGVPWPDEEFMKVTIERDLLIKRKFDEQEFLWDIFDFFAAAPGSLVYCSAILRGLMASLMFFWESCRNSRSTDTPKPLKATQQLLNCMTKCNFIPPKLGSSESLLDHVAPFEVFVLLKNVWKFMQDNPPITESKDWSKIVIDVKYMDTIRLIIQKNISKLGQFYSVFFSTDT